MESPNPRFEILRNTQVAIFRESGVTPENLKGIIQLLSPKVIADRLGLAYIECDDLGSTNSGHRIAGILDRTNKLIHISQVFPLEQQRLTAMHEVVHYVMHSHIGAKIMHRDRPINPGDSYLSDPVEIEATRLACLYLMPEKLVKRVFESHFMVTAGEALELDEQAAFYLNISIEDLRKMTRRQKALVLSTTRTYGRQFVPLHQFFEVSPTAMAIRLEELELIARDRWRGKPTLRRVK